MIKNLSYRGKGWPGKITVLLKNGSKKIIPRGEDQKSYFRRVIYSSAFHFDFMNPRCLLCLDQSNIFSDISFGDAWLPGLMEKDKTGSSLAISRSLIGEELIRKASSSKEIELIKISEDLILQSQNWSFKRNSSSRILTLKLLGKSIPNYSLGLFQPSLTSHLRIMPYLICYFSSKRYLWYLFYLNAILRSLIGRFVGKIVRIIR